MEQTSSTWAALVVVAFDHPPRKAVKRFFVRALVWAISPLILWVMKLEGSLDV